jgi:hypothetical protein
MSGSPFEALQVACESIVDSLFPNGQKQFENIHLCYYQSQIDAKVVNDKESFLTHVKKQSCGGGTDF